MSSRFSVIRDQKQIPRQSTENYSSLPRWARLAAVYPRVMRLGLATRGNTHLSADDVAYAATRGVNYLNWCGYDDGIAQAVREKRIERNRVVVAMQLDARDASSAARELDDSLRALGTHRIDVVTFYYVEHMSEWEQISGTGGALRALQDARKQGRVGLIGLTTHQRKLAAACALKNKLDLLMVRYNAAHRGAEQDVFPVTKQLGMPVVTYTAQRWGVLPRSTESDPPGFAPPPAREWYRFALAHPAVNVVLMAPNGRRELEEDLYLIDDWRLPTTAEFDAMKAHGLRVRRHAVQFP